MKKLIAVGIIGIAVGAGVFQLSAANAETTTVQETTSDRTCMMSNMMNGMTGEKSSWMSNMMGPMHGKMQERMQAKMDTPEGQAMIEACNDFWNRQNIDNSEG
ncbi:hypothetical protein [Heliorestis acidaminivorans]|uniref:hypothetical protein n=1 Tax=Heliorestis acidaminivorans TaxID=553427 RepID=UPI001FA97290|nr:hypothetical protein [Heliorestis acidaminivorans]